MSRHHTARWLTIALAVLMLIGSAPASAAETWAGNFRGQAASAHFSVADGCVETRAFAFMAEESNLIVPGSPNKTAFAAIGIFQSDTCLGTQRTVGFGYTEDVAISTNGLGSATLQGTINVYNLVSQSPMSLDVNVTWVGNGSPSQENYQYHYQSDGFTATGHSTGSTRPAVASGSFTVGGVPLFAAQTQEARLMLATHGSVSIVY